MTQAEADKLLREFWATENPSEFLQIAKALFLPGSLLVCTRLGFETAFLVLQINHSIFPSDWCIDITTLNSHGTLCDTNSIGKYNRHFVSNVYVPKK